MGALLLIVICIVLAYWFGKAIHIHHSRGGSDINGSVQMSTPVKKIYQYMYGETESITPVNNVQTASNTQISSNNRNIETPSRIATRTTGGQMNETGAMVYFANDKHQSQDKVYKFNFVQSGNSWKAYILRMPSLNGRESGYVVTHRLSDSKGEYVCWDSEVKCLKDMQAIARHWADCIQEYIVTGKKFG